MTSFEMESRLTKARRKMTDEGIEAVLVTHNANVFYLSGFSGSSGFILLTLEDAFLYTDFRYLQQAEEQARFFEVVRVTGSNDYESAAAFLKKKGLKTLYLEEAHITLREYNQLQEKIRLIAAAVELLPLHNFFEELRALKEDSEIELIKSAAAAADEALRQTVSLLKPGMTELEVASELEYRLRRGGSERLPFDIIVASGVRSSLPHGVATGKLINEGELVTIDCGAVYGGYSSDVSRTFVLGSPSQKQQEIFDLVLEAQQLGIGSLKSGVECSSVDALVRNYLQKRGYGSCFGHGLGHGVGIEVHELPTLSPRGKGTLQEGMVFTVEPGIYLEGWGGVRIEDLVVLTPGGPRIITAVEKYFEVG